MGVDNGAVARRYLTELWGKGNVDLIDELVDPQIKLVDPMTPGGVQGLDVVRERVQGMSKEFDDNSLTIDEVIVAGDRVIVRTTWSGVHRGDFFGFKNTGRRASCKTVELLRISNGKVIENLSYFDTYEMFQQLGILPSPDQLRDALKPQAAASQPTATA